MTLSVKTVLGFKSESDATRAGATLGETPGFEEMPLVLCESDSTWMLEVYDGGAFSSTAISAILTASGIEIVKLTTEAIPELDWVRETQKALPPVKAARFLVHGSHDRARAISRWAIEIDAGRAFGTAHHGTTRGCLLAIDCLARKLAVKSVLDLGTGSGVLAIASAKAFPNALTAAVDIDPTAIEVARQNCRINKAAGRVRLYVGDGFKPSAAYKGAFDVVIANILARPLLKLAPRLHSLTRPDRSLILSGLLTSQAREILGRYLSCGFRLSRRWNLEGWTTLLLRRTL